MAHYTQDDFLELNEEILKRGNYLRFRIKGESMRPFLRDGQVVIVKRLDPSEMRAGDIIFLRFPPSQIVIHRLIKKTLENGKTVFLTKGDASFHFDPYVYSENILGKIVAIEKGQRYIKLDAPVARLKSIYYVKRFLIKRWLWLAVKKIRRELLFRIPGLILKRLQSVRGYAYLARRLAAGKVTYRTAAESDVFSLAQLFKVYRPGVKREALAEFFRKYLNDLADSGYCILAEYGNKVVGSATVREFSAGKAIFSGWRIYNVLVYWRYRRLGIGEGLIRTAIEKAVERGARSGKAIIDRRNTRTISLAKKIGARKIGETSSGRVIYELKISKE
jgi:signal peptidase